MNISEVKQLVEGASYEEKIQILENICQRVGDCLENGYLGSAVANISYDEFDKVEFQSEKVIDDTVIKSVGAVLENSVIIMQVQTSENKKLYQFYSWELDASRYTYLTLDSVLALKNAYIEAKRKNIDFLAENLDIYLNELGISYRDVMDVKVAIRMEKQISDEIEPFVVERLETSFVS